jgi:membrane protease YdiL (CAAX protease family)
VGERRPGWGWVVALLALLAGANVANNIALRGGYPWLSLGELAVVAALAYGAGLTLADLGLDPAAARRGAAVGVACVVLVGLGYAVVALTPLGREAFLDRRTALGWGDAVFAALVTVPVGTVLLEELAFRGVLWGLVARLASPAWATALSAVAFGLWHVVPALGLGRNNPAVAGTIGTHVALVAAFGVAVTVLAGVVLGELRRRTGSLLAPLGLHWATNALGYLVGAAAWSIHI